MKYVRMFMALAVVLTLCSAFTMKSKDKPVYAFGIAASFNDSVVYYTDIQILDSVSLGKGGMLPQRELYSYQLKNYVDYHKQKPNYTCMIYFDENKKKLQKEVDRVIAKYRKSRMVLEEVPVADFKFEKPED